MVKIMNMLIRTQKCPTSWKEGKVVMLQKPSSEEEKKLSMVVVSITLELIF
jgi:hypothetical protein